MIGSIKSYSKELPKLSNFPGWLKTDYLLTHLVASNSIIESAWPEFKKCRCTLGA